MALPHLGPSGVVAFIGAFNEAFHHRLQAMVAASSQREKRHGTIRLGDRAADDFVPSEVLLQLLKSACHADLQLY